MRASAPASSANLGAGFDSLALALDLRCEVEVDFSSDWEIAEDRDGFLREAAERLSADPLRVQVRSDIPIGKGLGSSAAVLAALELAVSRLRGDPDRFDRIFESVTLVEGHPDNAAAAVFGGFVLAGRGEVHRLEIHPSLSVILAVPNETLPTGDARRALPESVPLPVASRTGRRTVSLVEGMRTGSPGLLRGGLGDELHEPHRIALRPVIGQLVSAALEAGAAFAAISGAGPSVLALVTDAARGEVTWALESIVGDGSVLNPAVATEGLR